MPLIPPATTSNRTKLVVSADGSGRVPLDHRHRCSLPPTAQATQPTACAIRAGIRGSAARNGRWLVGRTRPPCAQRFVQLWLCL